MPTAFGVTCVVGGGGAWVRLLCNGNVDTSEWVVLRYMASIQRVVKYKAWDGGGGEVSGSYPGVLMAAVRYVWWGCL